MNPELLTHVHLYLLDLPSSMDPALLTRVHLYLLDLPRSMNPELLTHVHLYLLDLPRSMDPELLTHVHLYLLDLPRSMNPELPNKPFRDIFERTSLCLTICADRGKTYTHVRKFTLHNYNSCVSFINLNWYKAN